MKTAGESLRRCNYTVQMKFSGDNSKCTETANEWPAEEHPSVEVWDGREGAEAHRGNETGPVIYICYRWNYDSKELPEEIQKTAKQE